MGVLLSVALMLGIVFTVFGCALFSARMEEKFARRERLDELYKCVERGE